MIDLLSLHCSYSLIFCRSLFGLNCSLFQPNPTLNLLSGVFVALLSVTERLFNCLDNDLFLLRSHLLQVYMFWRTGFPFLFDCIKVLLKLRSKFSNSFVWVEAKKLLTRKIIGTLRCRFSLSLLRNSSPSGVFDPL